MAAKQHSDARSEGQVFGQSSNDSIGFYGATPVTQPASSSQSSTASVAVSAVTSTPATSTSPFGFGTSTQADNIVTRLASCVTRVNELSVLTNQLRKELVSLGLIKGSA